jgi:hypothetical protein
MAYTSKSGERFSNASQAYLANKYHDSKTATPAPKVSTTPNPEEQQPEEHPEQSDPQSVVAEHGPASEVIIRHSEGSHSVHSVHATHKHHSEHETAEEAHSAAKTLSGADESGSSDDPSMGDMNPSAMMMGE